MRSETALGNTLNCKWNGQIVLPERKKDLTLGLKCGIIYVISFVSRYKEESEMVQVEVKVDSGEAFDRALARFKKMCGKAGIVTEIKKRSFYEKPSEKRRRIEMKRQRKVKPRTMEYRPRYNNGR